MSAFMVKWYVFLTTVVLPDIFFAHRPDAVYLMDGVRTKRKAVDNRNLSPLGLSVDYIGALPEELLHKILFFLPAQYAVKMCVLARRWRHLWETAPGLRISWPDDIPTKGLREFVDKLLLLRDNSPIYRCVIDLCGIYDEDSAHIPVWIKHVLKCKAEFLGLILLRDEEPVCTEVHDLRLNSEFLKSLDLTFIKFNDRFLDFSSCPALEVLVISCCDLSCATKISSRSLKRLSIESCQFNDCFPTRVQSPNLVSLRLSVHNGKIPVLERMPSLVDAVVELEYHGSCYVVVHNSMLLQGLSEAKYLELICSVNMVAFPRNLKWCPTFSNLKTLFLNEYWCVPDTDALANMLERSPVLEELTLQLFCKGAKKKVEVKGRQASEVSRAICKDLKIVRLECAKVNDEVLGVLAYLSGLNISFQFSPLNHTPVQGGAASSGGHGGNLIMIDSDD